MIKLRFLVVLTLAGGNIAPVLYLTSISGLILMGVAVPATIGFGGSTRTASLDRRNAKVLIAIQSSGVSSLFSSFIARA